MWLPLREVHIVRIGAGKILALPKIGLTAPLPPNLGTIVDLATKSAKFDSQFNFEKMFTIEGEWSTFFSRKVATFIGKRNHFWEFIISFGGALHCIKITKILAGVRHPPPFFFGNAKILTASIL